MPWKPSDAHRFTKKADTPAKKRRWASVANDMLQRGATESAAIKAANSAVKHKKKR